jgi:glutamate dehydrogenase
VLRDNEVQSAAISMLEHRAAQRLDEHAHLIRTLERDGLVNRAIECLPDEEELKDRRREGRGLTRPELAVLLAYSKISLYTAMLESTVPDDPYFEIDLLANFPPLLVEQFRDALVRHRLRREIIATLLTNAVVNRMGSAFSHRMAQDHGMPRAEIIRAYASAHRIYDGDRYWQAIEQLDNRVPASLQYQLLERTAGLLKHATGWLLHPRMTRRTVGDNVSFFERSVAEVEALLPDLLPASYREEWSRAAAALIAEGVPAELANRMASTRVLGSALDIVELAHAAKVPLAEAATVYFETGERFHMPWIYAAINGLQVNGQWHALARGNLRGDAYRLQRMLAEHILEHPGENAAQRIQAWAEPHQDRVAFAENRLRELRNSGTVDFMGLVVAVRELRKLRKI